MIMKHGQSIDISHAQVNGKIVKIFTVNKEYACLSYKEAIETCKELKK